VPKARFLIVGCWVLVMTARCWGEDPPLGRSYGETSVAFAPNSEWVVTGGADSMVRIRDANEGELLATLVGHDRMVTAVAISPDGQTIVSGSNDGSVRLWDVKSRAERRVLRAPEFTWGISLAFAPDGQTIAAGSSDGRLRLWDVASGELKASWKAGPRGMDVVVYTPDGRTIATVGEDRIVRFWDAQSHSLRRELPPMEKNLVRLAFSTDGSLLAVSSFNTILLLDAQTGKERSRLSGYLGSVRALAFTPDGGHLATGGSTTVCLNSTGTIVDQDAPRVLRQFPGPSCVALAISHSGQKLALCYLHMRDTGHASFEMLTLPSP